MCLYVFVFLCVRGKGEIMCVCVRVCVYAGFLCKCLRVNQVLVCARMCVCVFGTK